MCIPSADQRSRNPLFNANILDTGGSDPHNPLFESRGPGGGVSTPGGGEANPLFNDSMNILDTRDSMGEGNPLFETGNATPAGGADNPLFGDIMASGEHAAGDKNNPLWESGGAASPTIARRAATETARRQ